MKNRRKKNVNKQREVTRRTRTFIYTLPSFGASLLFCFSWYVNNNRHMPRNAEFSLSLKIKNPSWKFILKISQREIFVFLIFSFFVGTPCGLQRLVDNKTWIRYKQQRYVLILQCFFNKYVYTCASFSSVNWNQETVKWSEKSCEFPSVPIFLVSLFSCLVRPLSSLLIFLRDGL